MHPLARRRPTLLAAVLLAVALLTGCGAREAATPAQPRIVLILIDRSGSTAAVREQYLAEAARILAAVPAGTRLVVLPVSARSLTTPAAVDITFPEYVWWRSTRFTHSREVGRLVRQAKEAVAALLRQEPDGTGTALIDSLLQAQDFLTEYPAGAAAIYILSDMVEQSELVDLYNLDEASVAKTLARVEEAGRLPDLQGAAVSVAGLEAAGHLGSDRVLAVRSFWEGFFERAGAQLRSYSPTLKLPEGL